MEKMDARFGFSMSLSIKNYAMQKFCNFSNFTEPCNHKKEGRVRRLFLFSSLKKTVVEGQMWMPAGSL